MRPRSKQTTQFCSISMTLAETAAGADPVARATGHTTIGGVLDRWHLKHDERAAKLSALQFGQSQSPVRRSTGGATLWLKTTTSMKGFFLPHLRHSGLEP